MYLCTGEVGGLSAAGDPLPQDEEEEEVASGEAQSQFPLRISDAAVNVGRLVKDVVAENGGRMGELFLLRNLIQYKPFIR